MLFLHPMDPSVIEHQVNSGPCFAKLTGDEIIIGNELFEQHWRFTHGLLLPAGMREHISIDDWVFLPQPQPPGPSQPLPACVGEVRFSITGGPYFAMEPDSLVVELRFPFGDDLISAESEPLLVLVYSFHIFPGSTSISIELETVFFDKPSHGFDI